MKDNKNGKWQTKLKKMEKKKNRSPNFLKYDIRENMKYEYLYKKKSCETHRIGEI